MVRAFDKKYKCKHFIFIERTKFNTEYPSLDKRVRWCYENIPEDRLWDYEYEAWAHDSERFGYPKGPITEWNLRIFFEIEEDAMAFKLMFL